MKYRTLGNIKDRVSCLGFGSMRFLTDKDGNIIQEKVNELIKTAMESGITYYDTAYVYHATCNLGEVKGGLAYNIVMPSVEIVFEARSLNHDKLENLLNQVHLVFKETCSELNARFESTVKIQTPGFMIDEDDEISRAVVNACEKIGLQAEFKTSGGASDANIYNSKGIKSLNLACGMSEVHTVQEYLRIEDLVKTTELITALMEEYK